MIKQGRALAALAVVVGSIGCGDDAQQPSPPGRASAPPAAGAARSTPEPAAAPPVGTALHVRAADGKRLRARLAPAGRRAPAVIVLHTSDNARSEFNRLAGTLRDEGYAVLSLDARFKFHSLRDVTEQKDERAVARDVAGGAAFLRRSATVAPSTVGVVAQSMGAAGVALAMADDPRALNAAVAISPPDSQFALERQLDDAYAPRGVLFISDAAERTNAENLADGARESEVWEAPVDGHGYELLSDHRVRERLLGWLDERLRDRGAAMRVSPAAARVLTTP